MAECNIETLLTDACTNEFKQAAQNEILFRALLLQLACNLASGGAGLQCGDYSGGAPNFTPSGTCGTALDTSTGTLWYYYNSAWH
jgi:hypothetical protein